MIVAMVLFSFRQPHVNICLQNKMSDSFVVSCR